jgi:hypothetical protein
MSSQSSPSSTVTDSMPGRVAPVVEYRLREGRFFQRLPLISSPIEPLFCYANMPRKPFS